MTKLLVVGACMIPMNATLGAELERGAASADSPILTADSPWRCYLAWRSPLARREDGQLSQLTRHVGDGSDATPPPPAGWTGVDFDDRAWVLTRAAEAAPEYGPYYGIGWTRAVQYLRGRFEVTDPDKAKDLKLSLVCRGGVAVCLNGKEIARGHLPKGKLTGHTPADDYAVDCFSYPDGKKVRGHRLLPHRGQWDWKEHKAAYAARHRRLESIAIPPSALRRGVNVLAIEVHRSPYPEAVLSRRNRSDMQRKTRIWETCGLVHVRLTAGGEAGVVRPNLPGPGAMRIWAESPMRRPTVLSHGDPLGRPGEVVILAARNGAFCGQVVVSSDKPLRQVRAAATELKHADGGAGIPAAAVKLLYAVRDDSMLMRRRDRRWSKLGFFDTLVEQPPAQVPVAKAADGAAAAAVLPIWVKVRVPADAEPGEYVGELTVTAGRKKLAALPVRLRVSRFKLPDPRDYVTHVALIQSPESVALYYKVPLWSERHWALLERSFALLGEVGNKLVVLPLICRTNFGNEHSLIRWAKQPDGGHKGDFTAFDRYLDLAQKYLTPDVVCLYLWDRHMDQYQMTGHSVPTGETDDRDPARVTAVDPASGKTGWMVAPRYGTPEAIAFWKPVLTEARARLKQRGLEAAAMLGMTGDRFWQPTKATVAQLKQMLPGLKWIENAHKHTNAVHGEPVGYHTDVYVALRPPAGNRIYTSQRAYGAAGRYYGWKRPVVTDIYPRTQNVTGGALTPASNLVQCRVFLEAAQFSSYSGLGRTGADFWPVLGRSNLSREHTKVFKDSLSLVARYPLSSWKQLNIENATEALLAPGPDGPTSTARFENIRLGLQETEARIFIEKALTNPARHARLGPDLARRAQETLDRRGWIIYTACRSGGWEPYPVLAPQLAEELFTIAADVTAKLGAGG